MKLVYMIAHHRSFKRVTSEPRPAHKSPRNGVQDLTQYLHLHATKKEVNMTTKTKEEGMAQALDNANIDWKNEVEKRMTFLLENKRFFTSDDVLVYLTDRNIKTHNNSALGSVFNKYARRGYITTAGFVLSTRPSRHKAPIRLWKSNLYRKGRA